MKSSIVFACCLVAANAFAAPCDGVNKEVSESQRAAYAPAIEVHLNKQLGPNIQKVIKTEPGDVLSVMQFGKWHIVKVNGHITTEPFLFYRDSPLESSGYVSIWANTVEADDGDEVLQWEALKVRGIPKELAGCFAWQVTQGPKS